MSPASYHEETTFSMYEYDVKKQTTPSGTIEHISNSSVPERISIKN